MADVLGTTFSVGNGLSSGSESNADLLVTAFRKTKQPQIDALTQRKTKLETRQTFLNGFRTRLEDLKAKYSAFLDTSYSEKFSAKKTTSSDTSIVTTSSDTTAVAGTYNLKVNRLASNDVLVSNRKIASVTSALAGTSQNFDIDGVSYSVAIEATDTNETALTKIASAINSDSDSKVRASVIKDTSSTVRLSLTSKSSGTENDIDFTDSELLGDLGITSAALNPDTDTRVKLTTTNAGYQKSSKSDLDASLTLDGIDVTRSSNTISDLLSGVTLNLKKAQAADESAIEITSDTDTDSVAKNIIQPLLDSYNETLRYLNSNTTQLRADSALQSFRSRLRGVVSEPVSSADSGNPKYLTELGITIGSDGTLTISDRDKLDGLLKEDPKKVSDLFTGTDGFASKLDNILNGLLGESGLITARTTDIRSQIVSVDSRTKEVQKRVDNQAESLKKEYETLQRNYLKAQAQFNTLSAFTTS